MRGIGGWQYIEAGGGKKALKEKTPSAIEPFPDESEKQKVVWVKGGCQGISCLPVTAWLPGSCGAAAAQHQKRVLDCILLAQEKIKMQNVLKKKNQNSKYGFY